MYSLNKTLFRTILCTLFTLSLTNVNSQVLTNTFVDPCTKKVTIFVVPISGTIVVFMGKSKYFSSTDVRNGSFMAWINQVYAEYSAPCPVAQITQQVTTTTVANSVSGAVSSAASSAAAAASAAIPPPPPAAPPPPPPASAPPASGGSSSSSNSSSESKPPESSDSKSEQKSESKSESKEEQKSEDKKEEKKEEKKSDKKDEKKKNNSKSAMTPIVFSSDMSSVKQLQGDFNLMANLGLSRASLAGDVSYGATAIIFSNLKQFALSTRYSKMEFSNRELCGIGTYSYTAAYNDGTMLHIGGFSYVMMKNSYIYGYNLALIGTKIPFEDTRQTFLASSITLFGMKPITYSKSLNLTPEIFIMSSPLSYTAKSNEMMTTSQLTYIIGNTFDIALTKKFRISLNIKYMGPVHTIGVLIGSRFNL